MRNFDFNNLMGTSMQSDMFSYSADAAEFRDLSRRFVTLGIRVTVCRDPMRMETVVTLWEGGDELVSRGFDERTGGHNACYWMRQQLQAYSSWK